MLILILLIVIILIIILFFVFRKNDNQLFIITKPTDPNYNELRQLWDKRIQCFPKLIIQPLTQEGVSEAVQKYRPFALRSGVIIFRIGLARVII